MVEDTWVAVTRSSERHRRFRAQSFKSGLIGLIVCTVSILEMSLSTTHVPTVVSAPPLRSVLACCIRWVLLPVISDPCPVGLADDGVTGFIEAGPDTPKIRVV
jgi:hypothetical protein